MPLKSLKSPKIKYHFQRFEWKYNLPITFADKLIPDLLRHMDWDPFVENLDEKAYQVNSLYLDTDNFLSFFEKMDGMKVRKKLRLRYYGNSLDKDGNIYVEIKRKYDAIIIKDRLVLPFKDVDPILFGHDGWHKTDDFSRDQKMTLQEFLWTTKRLRMKPKILISYLRRPFVDKKNPRFRITLDSHIRANSSDALGDSCDLIDVSGRNLIMEVKYDNNLPHWFYHIIQKYRLEREPYSKYCTSLIKIKPYSNYIFDLNNHE
jgi:hypothetical protein